MATLIDISKKCDTTCTCYANQEKDITAKREDNVTQLDKYGHCTHNAGSKQLALYWKTIKLETTSGISFTKLQSVTTYYYSQYEPGSTIKRPLIIRVQTGTGNTFWYENAGHHTHKKWRRIGSTDNYPRNDDYDSCSELNEKLIDVGCRLYGYHQIDIQHTGRYSYMCPICQKQVTGSIVQENHIPGVSGYTKYRHGNITDKSILTHNGKKITYKRKDNGETYYIPIPINDANIKNISVYYWDRDARRDNPLLIEILGSGVSFWFENIGELSEKNEKWKQLGRQESDSLSGNARKLQERLDLLNCNINGVVHIKFGVTKCHSSNTVKHKNRITSIFTRTLETYLISSYEYTPSDDSRKNSFVISKFVRGGADQRFQPDVLPLREVKKLIYYMSPCDIPNPFLVYVELDSGNRWFKRTDGDEWKENGVEFSNRTPEKVTDQIITLFNQIKISLGIRDCPQFVQGSIYGVKLDIKETSGKEHSKVYYSNGTSILITKTERYPKYRFFKNSHSATKVPFDVDHRLQNDEDRIGGTTHRNVSDFSVYFWDGAPNTPILIGISKDGKGPKYYGKNGTTKGLSWRTTTLPGMDEIQALDHQNCVINNAIPFDIEDPLIFSASTSNCLNKTMEKISGSTPQPINSEYEYFFGRYRISKNNAKISRVIFRGDDTNIEPPLNTISQVKIYYWGRRPSVPLIVEFIPQGSGDHHWFERSTLSGTVWKPIDQLESRDYYSGVKKSDPTQQFIKRLDKVSCKINHAAKIDISKKDVKYCHDKCLNKRIYSKRTSSTIPNYIIYEHTPDIDSEKTFILSSIYNGDDKQDIGNIELNLGDVKKVAVYFPACNEGFPIYIYIYIYHVKKDAGYEKWLERTHLGKNWTESTLKFQNKSVAISDLLDATKYTIGACSKSALDNQGNLNAQTGLIGRTLTLDNDTVEKGLIDYGGNVDEIDVEDEIYEVEDKDSFAIPTLSALVKATPGFTIDVKKTPSSGDMDTYTLPDGKIVQLAQSVDPEKSGFLKFKHTKSGGRSFKLEKVTYNQTDIDYSQLQISDNDIEYLSVWYWEGDQDMTNPLLIEVRIQSGEYKYGKSIGNTNWVEHYRPHSEEKDPLPPEALEQELDDLNCHLNQAVTMDISHGKGVPYCCNKSHKKVNVYSQNISIASISNMASASSGIYCSIHSIGENDRLAKIKYYRNGSSPGTPRERVAAAEISFPIQGPVSIYAFYCNNNPSLIYIEATSGRGVNGWYKKGRNYKDPWTKIVNDLTDVTPTNANASCTNWNALKKVFGCGMEDCISNSGCSNSGSSITVTFDQSSPQALVQPQIRSPPEVTIQIGVKPKDDNAIDTYNDETTRKLITVTRSLYPSNPNTGSTGNFYRYTHTLGPGKTPFTLKGVLDDTGKEISGIPHAGSDNKVSSVSAYYWTGNTRKALLVEIHDSIGNKTYYRNTKKDNWEKYNLRVPHGEKPTKEELDLLNCEINDVVQIDIYETRNVKYCHSGHEPLDYRVKVDEITEASNELMNYHVYKHELNPDVYTTTLIHTFNISVFTGGRTQTIKLGETPGKPIRDVKKVIVYFCISDYQRTPLLIYVDSEKLSSKKWFKSENEGTTWREAVGLSNENDYPKIVETLDKLGSKCGPPSVSIDIYNRENSGDLSSYAYDSGKYIYVTPKVTGTFTEYKHSVKERPGNYFTVTDFKYDGKPTRGSLGKTERVTSVSTYYWSALEVPARTGYNRGRPLLLKITRNGKSLLYYENTDPTENASWQHTVIHDKLEAKLHLLNCRLNNAVVIDVSKVPGDNHGSNSIQYDSCEYNDKQKLDGYHGEKMQVSKDSDQSLGNYTVCSHTLKNPALFGQKFHVVSFKNGSHIITLNGLGTYSTPILDVEEVKVYMCEKDNPNKPLLIYYKTGSAHYWYKNNSSDADVGSWTTVGSDLSTSHAPEGNHDKILGVLSTIKSECNPPPTPTPTPEKSIGAGILAGYGIYGIVSGVFGGTGLSGLAGWKLYNRYNGDPWVRQI
ncbi:reverse transcriptase domain containing protein [Theileria equi strain WA]|uniref:Reverse transcriptase domain containing protein n=1 Tax=Theileria equi strain WA TaxID=1537102 RepID=L0AXI6_THEEQ|nr:reverse transcriptase domain containing protein [Theileria equi strain WA]AFZ79736.1 reverse transcriptase domain containing protein [Theileria equi strain WA]|eukprot:XP_004829402.1 reverse transcriptase domain containing protein [Theileria equi strain WA]